MCVASVRQNFWILRLPHTLEHTCGGGGNSALRLNLSRTLLFEVCVGVHPKSKPGGTQVALVEVPKGGLQCTPS